MSQVCGWNTGTASSGPARCGKPATGRRIEPVGPSTDDHLVCGIHARSARTRGVHVEPLTSVGVRIGQVWHSTDPREDRHVVVTETVPGFAWTLRCTPDGHPNGPRRSRIRVSNGALRGYRLVRLVRQRRPRPRRPPAASPLPPPPPRKEMSRCVSR